MWNKAPEAVGFCCIGIRVFSCKQQKCSSLDWNKFIKNTLPTSQICQWGLENQSWNCVARTVPRTRLQNQSGEQKSAPAARPGHWSLHCSSCRARDSVLSQLLCCRESLAPPLPLCDTSFFKVWWKSDWSCACNLAARGRWKQVSYIFILCNRSQVLFLQGFINWRIFVVIGKKFICFGTYWNDPMFYFVVNVLVFFLTLHLWMLGMNPTCHYELFF